MVTCDEAVATLNDEESGAKQRERALAALAELALSDSGAVFSSIQQLDRAFEAVLIDREEGKKKYGTSLGRMHEMMLIVLIRATNYGLSTSQLLEFVGGDVALALAIVQSILKVPAYEDELFAAVVQLLHGFLLPQTYAPAGGSALELQIEDFSSHVVAFSRALLKAKMLLQLPGQLAQRLFPASEGVVTTSAWPVARVVAAEAFLKLLTNAYELVHDDFDALRSEISAATDTVTAVLVPLLRAAAATAPGGGPPPLLGLTIRALILCAFGAPRKVLRAAVATAPFEELLGFARGGAQPLKATGLYFAMLANVDALSALSDATAETAERARADSLVVAVQAAVEVLSVDDASSLHAAMNASGPRRLLADPGPRRLLASLPISRDSPTADDLGVILQQRLLVAQPDVSSELRDQLAGLEVKAAQLEALQEELVSAEQQQLVSAEHVVAVAVAQLQTLEAEVAEGEAVAQELGERLGVDLREEVPPPEPPPPPDAAAEPPPPPPAAAEATAPPAPTKASSRYRLLGELPQVGGAPTANRAQRPRRPPRAKKGASDDGKPEGWSDEFKCAITGSVMRRPVRTPDGAVYEAATVERWLSEQGSIDPLTGAHLTKDMLEPCKELKRRLEKWHLQQAMQKGAAADADADNAF